MCFVCFSCWKPMLPFSWMNLNKAYHFLPNSHCTHLLLLQCQVITIIISRCRVQHTGSHAITMCSDASQVFIHQLNHTHLWHTYRAHKEINNRNIWDSLPQGALSSPRKKPCNWRKQNNFGGNRAWKKNRAWEKNKLALLNWVLIVNVDNTIYFAHIVSTVQNMPENTVHLVS